MNSGALKVILVIILSILKYGLFADDSFSRHENFSSARIYPDEMDTMQKSRSEFLELQTQQSIRIYCPEVDVNDILFSLYTREFQTMYNLRVDDWAALEKSTYNIHKPTKIIIHGWNQNGDVFAPKIKTAYLQKEDVNVISVDWGRYATCEFVYTYTKIIPAVAGALARVLKMLYKYGSKPEYTSIVGHSFGADIAGLANQNLTGQQAPLIIGLDPAGGLSYLSLPTRRLYTGDANFVMIIHTNMGFAGMAGRLGHVDFYPNGGAFQPGCYKLDPTCSHERSVAYFTESISSQTGFYGIKCLDYKTYLAGLCVSNKQIIMSEDTPPTARGKYYLKTNSFKPYAQGKQRPV